MTGCDNEAAEEASGPILGNYLTIEELASELRVTPLTLARWRALRTGPPFTKMGHRVLYRRAAVTDWLLSQEQRASHNEQVPS